MTLRGEIEDIIEVNVRFVSNKDGISKEDSDYLPIALTPQICSLIHDAFVGMLGEKKDAPESITELSGKE